MSRAGSSAVSNAVRGLEPRAPELEIPRLFGAGVGAGFLPAARRLEPYRKLPERERRAVCNAIVTSILKDFWTMRATLSPTRALRKHFKRVTSHDAQRFADDVKRIRFFTVNNGAAEWVYKGKLKKRTSVKLVFERLDGREPSARAGEVRARAVQDHAAG